MTTALNMEKTFAVQDRTVLFKELYLLAFPAVAKYIHRNGGGFEDAKDIFHDALVAYYEKLVAGKLVVEQSDAAYLTGIARHLWSKKMEETKRLQQIGDFEPVVSEHTSSNKLLAFLENAGKKCMDMLKAFYYDKMPVEHVAENFGYSGVRSVTVQKYKCLEKLRDAVKEKSLTYADFTE